jgi:hypothetical protein
LLLIGGLDSRVLLRGPDEIRAEVMNIVPPLLERGHYLPTIDDNPRENVPYASYLAYRQVLNECVR